jgi:putative membrane protein
MSGRELLSAFSALFNLTSALLLVAGVAAIRRGERERHRRLVLTALASSALFLAAYLGRMGIYGHSPFGGTGWVRPVYFLVLVTHTPLAALIVPLVLRLLFLAQQERFEAHRRLARVVFPVWMYVSATGVLVYLFLRFGSPTG